MFCNCEGFYVMNFISRDDVIAIVKEFGACQAETLRRVKGIPSFPAPNPDGKDGRNVMGQTNDEFWEAVERQECVQPKPPKRPWNYWRGFP